MTVSSISGVTSTYSVRTTGASTTAGSTTTSSSTTSSIEGVSVETSTGVSTGTTTGASEEDDKNVDYLSASTTVYPYLSHLGTEAYEVFSFICIPLTTINYISSGHSIPNSPHASYNIFCTISVKNKRAFFSFSSACNIVQS